MLKYKKCLEDLVKLIARFGKILFVVEILTVRCVEALNVAETLTVRCVETLTARFVEIPEVI